MTSSAPSVLERCALAPARERVARDLARAQGLGRAPGVLSGAEHENGARADRREDLGERAPEPEREREERHEDEEDRPRHGAAREEVRREEQAAREERRHEEAAPLLHRRERLVVRAREPERHDGHEAHEREPRNLQREIGRRQLSERARQREKPADRDDQREEADRDGHVAGREKPAPAGLSPRGLTRSPRAAR